MLHRPDPQSKYFVAKTLCLVNTSVIYEHKKLQKCTLIKLALHFIILNRTHSVRPAIDLACRYHIAMIKGGFPNTAEITHIQLASICKLGNQFPVITWM